eukprot:CAMPEP_0194261996 /NCGR_PEP_ID=MMETSP0158-20130606/46317_1 /TAXON_ID=33649 /ORGANISM="Thalassionema nitzschioides, Strain L26-B" /LENGTH=929 /DNA_ID=CAMNT_0039002139 /DNA_START=67 /DNA_END=2856 /DNA_ORIENTATION=+
MPPVNKRTKWFIIASAWLLFACLILTLEYADNNKKISPDDRWHTAKSVFILGTISDRIDWQTLKTKYEEYIIQGDESRDERGQRHLTSYYEAELGNSKVMGTLSKLPMATDADTEYRQVITDDSLGIDDDLPPLLPSALPSTYTSVAPSMKPSEVQSESPSVDPTITIEYDPCPTIPPNGCSICGEGKCVTNPEGIVEFGGTTFPCGDLENFGSTGILTTEECEIVKATSNGACACDIGIPITGTRQPSGMPTLLSTLAPTSLLPCPEIPDGGCSVCGEGKIVGNVEAIFSFPGLPDIPCSTLEQSGLDGNIDLAECSQLPNLIEICECRDCDDTPSSPSIAPQQSFAPSTALCPEIPASGCSVCGEGKIVGNGDEIFIFPGSPDILCSELELTGLAGNIPLNQCGLLPDLIEVCECRDCDLRSASPSITPLQSPSPSGSPTLMPSLMPTTLNNGFTPCPDVPPGGCSVCGDGKCITSPDTEVDIGAEDPLSCADIEKAGLDGTLSDSECTLLQTFIDEPCACDIGIPTGDQSQSPTSEILQSFQPSALPSLVPSAISRDQSQSPTSEILQSFQPSVLPSVVPSATPTMLGNEYTPCPDVPPGGCSVCGDGKCITSPDTEVDIGAGAPFSCADIETAGLTGLFSDDDCKALQTFIDEPCACDVGVPVGAPTSSPFVTLSPTTLSPVIPTPRPQFIFPLPPTLPPVMPTARPQFIFPLPPTLSPAVPTPRPQFILPLPSPKPSEISIAPLPPSSPPTQGGMDGGLVRIPVYEYDRGNCPNAGSTGLACAPKNIHVLCSKSGGLFRDCLQACEPSFCCIHDSPKATNNVAPTCNTDENCAQYAPCYIIWWKIHDTIGPAPFVDLKQSDDFFETESLQDVTTDHDFFTQWLYHHWDDISILLQDLIKDSQDIGTLFSSPAVWDTDVSSNKIG